MLSADRRRENTEPSSQGKLSIMSKTQQMSSDWEEVVGEIEGKLLTLLASELNDICAALDLDVEEREKDSARVLRRRILQYLEGDDVTSLEDGGMSVSLDLRDKIDDVKISKHNEPVPQPVCNKRCKSSTVWTELLSQPVMQWSREKVFLLRVPQKQAP